MVCEMSEIFIVVRASVACSKCAVRVRVLVEAGADALATDGEGNGPAHWAALRGARGALRVLLHHAPRAAAAANAHGDTPL